MLSRHSSVKPSFEGFTISFPARSSAYWGTPFTTANRNTICPSGLLSVSASCGIRGVVVLLPPMVYHPVITVRQKSMNNRIFMMLYFLSVFVSTCKYTLFLLICKYIFRLGQLWPESHRGTSFGDTVPIPGLNHVQSLWVKSLRNMHARGKRPHKKAVLL